MDCLFANRLSRTQAVPNSSACLNRLAWSRYVPQLVLAKREHSAYCSVLRDLNIDVIELPSDELSPECPFVNDLAVVTNGTAFICKPASRQRLKEVELIRKTIEREIGIRIEEVEDPTATIEGGDVLFTGDEFFVGISPRTNEAGARALARVFPEFPTIPIKVMCKEPMKSVISMAGPGIICVSNSKEAQLMKREIEREATRQYQTVTVHDDRAANCLYANKTLIHRSEFPQSKLEFVRKIDFPRIELPLTHLSPVNVGLTSLSIMIEKPKCF
ncbi:N(G),N(G)-dimethylarginine dimethylaminohydrolase 1-like isoform X2 [Varroa jacobsoni]|uniref:N(G),N(G)-dimethylarginine dimethylaminohydrolase 1-like isoform X2 n=1 Tax=Varroa jacobsoni TaxID=62625 RepID=UPI000BF3D15E|nr:N(G),N(G)-dimethylarginine dimethylaminohydrolase 1-like isoform X2 [Varroa jacobsoni]